MEGIICNTPIWLTCEPNYDVIIKEVIHYTVVILLFETNMCK